jgi:cyclin-dependent kinase-like
MHSKYEVIGIVGEGAYGVVYKCKNKDNGEFVAIKKFKEVEDELVKKTMTRELRVLQMLKHDNIVEYKEAFKRKGNLFLVFEYVDKNLLELLQEHPKGLDPSVIKKVIYQLCKAIKYLHELNIVHRDIKPENLLVDANLKLKLCDFGFARTIKKNTEKLTDYVATRWYRSPELLITSGYYGPEVDYWAIGCIMGELADGDPLFPGDNEVDQLIVIQKVLGKLPEHQYELFQGNPGLKGKMPDFSKPETLERRYMGKLSKQAINFMKMLLHPDPKMRLKGDAIFSHPYFENYPDPFPSSSANNLHVVNKNPMTAMSQMTTVNPVMNQLNQMNLNQTSFPPTINNLETTSNGKLYPIHSQNPSLDKKPKNVQPIISNTTNINIINYNNYDGKNSHSPSHNVMHTNQTNQDPNMTSDKNLNLSKFANINEKKTVPNFGSNHHSKIINNNLGNNMLLTSYNFNQNFKDNILSMYSSTSFDKNFKTFYKGDPYNFDIDTNFMKTKKDEINGNTFSNKNNILNTIDEEKTKKIVNINPIKKPNYKPNEPNIGGMYPAFNASERTPPKNNKKKGQVSQVPIKNNNLMFNGGLDENYKLMHTKYGVNFKNSNTNMKNYANMKDFQLPSINNKNFSLKKLMK